MAKNTLPRRGTKRQPTKSTSDIHAEQSFNELKEQRAADANIHAEIDRVIKRTKEERDYDHAVDANGQRLLFEAKKSGFLSLPIPQMRDHADHKGKFDQQAFKRAVQIWKNNCYDLIAACKREGRNWRFSQDWKNSGVLFVHDESRVKRAS